MINKYALIILMLVLAPSGYAEFNGEVKGVESSSCYKSLKEVSNDYMLRAIGQGVNSAKAKLNALGKISGMIYTKVETSTTINSQELTSPNIKQPRYSSDVKVQQSISSKYTLTGVRLICEDSKTDKGVVYALYEFDSRSLTEKIISQLVKGHEEDGYSHINWQGNTGIARSTVFQRVESSLLNPKGDIAHFTLELTQVDGIWSLLVNRVKYQLSPIDLADIISSIKGSDSDLSIKLIDKNLESKSSFIDKEPFTMSVKCKGPAKYMSVFNVYEDGRVAQLEDSKPCENRTMPEIGIYQSGLLIPNEAAMDIYLVVRSDKPLQFTTLIDGQYVNGANSYSLDSLLRVLGNADVSYTSMIVTTYPR
jgi:hypothetical protein